jgi:hypothetical protein
MAGMRCEAQHPARVRFGIGLPSDRRLKMNGIVGRENSAVDGSRIWQGIRQ